MSTNGHTVPARPVRFNIPLRQWVEQAGRAGGSITATIDMRDRLARVGYAPIERDRAIAWRDVAGFRQSYDPGDYQLRNLPSLWLLGRLPGVVLTVEVRNAYPEWERVLPEAIGGYPRFHAHMVSLELITEPPSVVVTIRVHMDASRHYSDDPSTVHSCLVEVATVRSAAA